MWTHILCTLTKSSVYKACADFHTIIKLTSYAASCIIKLVTIILLLLLLGSASSTVST